MQACFIVNAFEPTAVANELETSFAPTRVMPTETNVPIPKAVKKATTKQVIGIHLYCSRAAILTAMR